MPMHRSIGLREEAAFRTHSGLECIRLVSCDRKVRVHSLLQFERTNFMTTRKPRERERAFNAASRSRTPRSRSSRHLHCEAS